MYREIIHDTFQQIDLVSRLITNFPESLVRATSSASVTSNFASGDARISSLMGIEGLHQIGNSASILRMYYNLGVRYATLTHTCDNIYADSEASETPLHGGLSERGKEIIREMNRLGMMVDISHTSHETQKAALAASRAPVIFSHSSAWKVCHHSRNVKDEVLFELKKNDGVVMITFYPEFTNIEPAKASLSDVADHIIYVGELIGYRHVGLGSDFDGMAKGPKGLEDVSKYPDLIEELFERGIRVEDIKKILGYNILRVLRAVEEVAVDLKHEKPLEDDVKPFFG